VHAFLHGLHWFLARNARLPARNARVVTGISQAVARN